MRQPPTTPLEETWSTYRQRTPSEERIIVEKRIIARYFAHHEFLVVEGSGYPPAYRTEANIFVNWGTSPNAVLTEALNWIYDKIEREPFDITWYTPGMLIAATLQAARCTRPEMRTATKLFLLPGEVSEERQTVMGRETEAFVNQLQTRFSYSFLSASAFDMRDGVAYHAFNNDVSLQRRCARLYASNKCVFLDSSKFRAEGNKAFDVDDLLETSRVVSFYTSHSEADQTIQRDFETLCEEHLIPPPACQEIGEGTMKILRLTVVGEDECTVMELHGHMRERLDNPRVALFPDITPQLLRHLVENPARFREMSPERFEHFVAERLERMGYAVTLCGKTLRKDGGVDFIAIPKNRGAGTFMLAGQVKHHATGNKSGREDVDRLLSLKNGIFRLGLLVTNTAFTNDAKWIAAQNDNAFFARLRDFNDLRRWLLEDFASDEEFRELPEYVDLAPGIRIRVRRPIRPLLPG